MMSNVRLCASVDQPPNIFHISDYVRMIESWAQTQPAVQCTVFRGQELVKKRSEWYLECRWSRRRAPCNELPPQFTPENDDDTLKHISWAGKGIIYDTGGLSLKSKTGMPGMKMDIGRRSCRLDRI